jgi:hypothetical protein
MASSLTQIAITARKTVRYGIFFIIFLIIGKIVFDIGKGVYQYFFPTPPPAPTVEYGKLPKLPFPEKAKPNLTFTLETAEGALPTLSEQAKVYFMPKLSPNLLSLDVAKEKAISLGFQPEEQEITQTLYRFNKKDIPAYLEMNIASGIFSISYDLKADRSPLERKPQAPEVSASQVRSYLSSANLLPEDLTGPTVHEFLKIDNERYITSLSLAESDLIKLNFFRKDYDSLPSLTSDVNKGNIWFVESGAPDRERQVIAAEYHYFPVDETKFSTYPLKPAQIAWDEFSQGNYYLAGQGLNKDGDNVIIRRMYLAYYDAGVPMDFYQPVIVFEGDKGFLGYVSAISTDYYGE